MSGLSRNAKGRIRPLHRTAAPIRKDLLLYLMVVPGVLFFLIFRYGPMYGLLLAFKDYNIYKGFAQSEWVGLANFVKLFDMYGFQRALENTLIISFAKIVFGFPFPIVFAILLNEVNRGKLKKFIQTSVCLPNFISWIVVQGLLFAMLSPHSGAIRDLANVVGYKGEILNILVSKEHFRSLIVVSDIWKQFGYNAIIFIATISSIDTQLYEAAIVDGAGKLQQIWYITLPGLQATIVIMFILRVGNVLDAGFDQIFALYNPMVYEVSEILDTFIYKIGIEKYNFSISTTAGLFKSLIGLGTVLIANHLANLVDPDSALIQKGGR